MQPHLNQREEHVLKSIMKPVETICPPGSPVYYEMALKLINQQLFSPDALVTVLGRQMLMRIVEKIAYSQMDDILEDIIAEAQEIQIESTKTQSFKKSQKNTSKGHSLIKAALQTAVGPMSRTDLANATNLRVSAVCARVRELIDEDAVRVSGTKWDSESERNVETLELV